MQIFFLLVYFHFLTKKTDFQAFFRLFTASVWSRPPGPPAVPGVFAFILLVNISLHWLISYAQQPLSLLEEIKTTL